MKKTMTEKTTLLTRYKRRSLRRSLPIRTRSNWCKTRRARFLGQELASRPKAFTKRHRGWRAGLRTQKPAPGQVSASRPLLLRLDEEVEVGARGTRDGCSVSGVGVSGGRRRGARGPAARCTGRVGEGEGAGVETPSVRTRLTGTVMVRSQRQSLPKTAMSGTTHTRDRGPWGWASRSGQQRC